MELRTAKNMSMIGDGSFLEYGPNKSNMKSMMLSITTVMQYKIAKIDPLVANRSFLSLSFSEGDLPRICFRGKNVINAKFIYFFMPQKIVRGLVQVPAPDFFRRA